MNRKSASQSVPILFTLVVLAFVGNISSAKLKLPSPVTIAMEYEVSEYTINKQKHEFPHFLIRSNLTYTEKQEKTQDVSFVPELHLDYTLTVDRNITGPAESDKWGILCEDKEGDDCIPGKVNTASKNPYQGTTYNYYIDKTVMCFLDKFEINQGDPEFSVRRINKFNNLESEPWKSGKSGVLGFGQNSALVNYIYKQYEVIPNQKYIKKKDDFVFGISIRLNTLNEDDRWAGKKKDTFKGSFMTINGYTEKDINNDDGIKWANSATSRWALNYGELKLTNQIPKNSNSNDISTNEKKSDIGSGTQCLDFNNPGAIILPNASPKRAELLKFVSQMLCKKDECNDSTEINDGPNLVLTIRLQEEKEDEFYFVLKPYDYIYHDKESKKTKISFGSLEESQSNGRCSNTDKMGLGRQFFLDRYVLFKRSVKEAQGLTVDYTWSIGISDKVADDDLSGLWLVYTISFSILGAMILLFILKTICLWNRDESKIGDEAEQVEDNNYAKADD